MQSPMVNTKPARNIITGRRNHPVGLYYSAKNGSGIQWESGNELHKLYLSEVSSDVVRYESQPEKLSVAINGRIRPYTPDLKEVMSDGRIIISEIKEDDPLAGLDRSQFIRKFSHEQ